MVMGELGPREIEALRAMIAARSGLAVPDERLGELAAAARVRARESGAADVPRWIARLAADVALCDREVERLGSALAVHETYFFRDRAQLEAIVDHGIPARPRARGRPLRLLSAGASTGAEAYSVAMLAGERRPELEGALEIVGIDLSRRAIEAARRGCYPAWALRGATEEDAQRWFEVRGDTVELRREVRDRVSFAVRNIVAPLDAFWAEGAFDVILCRNVLMYLTRDAAAMAVARMERALAPGGALFLGHAESLRGIETDLMPSREGGVLHYRRHPPALAPRAAASRPAAGRRDRDRAAAIAPDRVPAAPREAWMLDALRLVERGDLERAEEACREGSRLDELDPAVHYLRALCRDRAGDVVGAIRHDTAAAYLDPTFAMPCFHLGLMERRAGDERAARRELSRAEALLVHEDEARIAIFGGGLDRAALLRVCRAALGTGEEP